MKKTIFALVLVSSFVPVFASIDSNLKYGQNTTEVSELQDFLVDKGFLNATPTGFFGLMTLKAVKAYQSSISLPATGFVGPMTREKINAELALVVAEADEAEITETGTTTPVSISDVCKNVEGVQTSVPSGMWSNDGVSCFVPTVSTATVNYVPSVTSQTSTGNPATSTSTQTTSTQNPLTVPEPEIYLPPTAVFFKDTPKFFKVGTIFQSSVGLVRVDFKGNKKLRIKDIKYELISDTYQINDISITGSNTCGNLYFWSGKLTQEACGSEIAFFFNSKDYSLLSKAGTFKISITSLTVTDGQTDTQLDTIGLVSNEITVTQ